MVQDISLAGTSSGDGRTAPKRIRALRGMLIIAIPGTLLLGGLILQPRHRRPLQSRLGKHLLLCVSTLINWVETEAGATILERWIHRMPHLFERLTKPVEGSIEIAVIGESSARGEPFHPRLSIVQIVAWQLEEALPGRAVRAHALAEAGVTLERMHQKFEILAIWPAVMIIYDGHNEFQARYDSSWSPGFDEAPGNPLLHRCFRASLKSPFCRMTYELINKHRIDAPPPLNQHQLVDPPICTPSEADAILRDFHHRMESIVAYCRQMEIVPVLVIPPGNEAGYEPNRSTLTGTVSETDRARFYRDFQSARAAEDDPRASIVRYRALLERQSSFAEVHFRLGRLLAHQERWVEANRHFILARDNDGLPQRCPTPFQEVYRVVAAKHGAILIDGLAELRAISTHGMLDDELFHDGQHPTLRGHVGLAQAVLHELRVRKVLGWDQGRPPNSIPQNAPLTSESTPIPGQTSANEPVGSTTLPHPPVMIRPSDKRNRNVTFEHSARSSPAHGPKRPGSLDLGADRVLHLPRPDQSPQSVRGPMVNPDSPTYSGSSTGDRLGRFTASERRCLGHSDLFIDPPFRTLSPFQVLRALGFRSAIMMHHPRL